MTERQNKHLTLVTAENQEDLSWREPGQGLPRETDNLDMYVTDIIPSRELGARLRQFDADLHQLSCVEYAFSTSTTILSISYSPLRICP